MSFEKLNDYHLGYGILNVGPEAFERYRNILKPEKRFQAADLANKGIKNLIYKGYSVTPEKPGPTELGFKDFMEFIEKDRNL